MSEVTFGRVALLMGGWTAEREISLKSGAAVLEALKRLRVDVQVIDVQRDIVSVLQRERYDCVFNILHGRGGEDGTIQAFLELLDIPYTGSGVLASALAMDKLRCKVAWQGAGLPTPKAQLITTEQDCEMVGRQLALPVAVKPVFEGSSVGVTKVKHAEQLLPAWQAAREFGEVMAEQWIEGNEYTVGVLNGKALPVIRLQTANEFYDFDAKYNDAGTQYHCPSGLTDELEQQVQELALEAFDVLGCSGWGRVDLMLDSENKPWLIEVNTLPGMTDHSLVPMAAKAAGISFDELVAKILATATKKLGS